ncbi:MAG: hypothetical protein M1833_002933 [Piccolia ochrophora]|nr:MAG: hypothetical protein M1833_002933 [Piccolia ochrophora]
MPALALAGYHVVAPDQRGYGRTTGWDASSYEKVDMRSFSMTNLVRDMVAFVNALGYERVHCIVGHDFGAVTAAMCAMVRPDMFQRVVMMSHPFKGAPDIPFDTLHRRGAVAEQPQSSSKQENIHEALARLPQPRKHYKWYYSTPSANRDLLEPKAELASFLRAYFHAKSADSPDDSPQPLKSWTATELAKMPAYYIMPLHATMREAVEPAMPSRSTVEFASSRWLDNGELDVYVQEWGRTGFQGGLNWYRCATDPALLKDVEMFAGKEIDVPALFVAGVKDWGTYQEPGVLDGYPKLCKDFRGVRMIEDAGHWVQQEQPDRVVEEILTFLET